MVMPGMGSDLRHELHAHHPAPPKKELVFEVFPCSDKYFYGFRG